MYKQSTHNPQKQIEVVNDIAFNVVLMCPTNSKKKNNFSYEQNLKQFSFGYKSCTENSTNSFRSTNVLNF